MKTLTYQEEKTNNERIFNEMVQKMRPEIYVLMSLIDSTGINPFILYKTIRQLNNIAIGSGWGEVTILINNRKAVRVSGVDTEKMNDDVILKGEKL
jgi:hypothetical protein